VLQISRFENAIQNFQTSIGISIGITTCEFITILTLKYCFSPGL
jgi:hypothetical protein